MSSGVTLYATQIGRHIVRKFDRAGAYIKALLMLDQGYRMVTILSPDMEVEAKLIRSSRGGIEVWTPKKVTYERDGVSITEPDFNDKRSLSLYIGTLMPRYQEIKTASAVESKSAA